MNNSVEKKCLEEKENNFFLRNIANDVDRILGDILFIFVLPQKE